MPLEFIPNQPFIFEELLPDQPCMNNDNRVYSQIVQSNDNICVQQKMLPCDTEINCEPDMFASPAALGLSASLGSGWSSGGGLTSYSGSGGVVGNATYTPSTPLVAGNVYQVDITIDSVTGVCAIYVSLGLYTYPTELNTAGVYTFYVIAQTTTDTMVFTMVSDADSAGDTMVISNVALSTFTTCWSDSLDFGYPAFRFSFDTTTLQGKFCSINNLSVGQLTNTTAYTTDGNYHRVNLTITDCTAGGLEVILGGTYLGTTSGNGEFKFYGIPTDASGELIFNKVDAFDGCISYVTVDDFGLLDPTDLPNSVYTLVVANASGTGVTDEIPFVVFDDRITWCFSVSDLENGGNPIELSCNILYRLKISADCGSGATTYLSATSMRYDPDGWDCTKVVQGWCEGYNLGFFFGDIGNPTFKLTQRLRVLRYNPKYPIEGEEYLYSTGLNARSYATRGKVRECLFDRVDEKTHDVISAQILCDKLYIDAIECFVPNKDYEPEWGQNGKYNLAQSRIEIIQTNEPNIYKRNA